MSRAGCIALVAAFLVGTSCAASRKISQVGLREPSSVRPEALVSDLRRRIIETKEWPRSCPKDIRDHFSLLAQARVDFPICPQGFPELVQHSLPFLKLEERSTLEEVVSSQCRSLGNSEFGIESLVANFDSSGPSGRRSKLQEAASSLEKDQDLLQDLKANLQEIQDFHLPLDRWMRRNGEFVLPEEDLTQLIRLVEESSCRMTDQEVDYAYRTIRSLEELSTILKAGPQKERMESFLSGVHKVIEQKLKEFFYP